MNDDFESLGFSEPILKAIAESGYTTPTPIQAKAIPIVLRAQDVVGIAQTGTGKTASFTLPMIEILSGGRARTRMPRSLVLEPTRELAAQVAENFDKYGKYAPLSKALLVGGESMGEQMKLLERGVDVLIATPGRLLDLFERGAILLSDIKILVIDEADRMMDMGFIPDIERIISLVPRTRQTLLFSATMPPEIRKLAAKFLVHAKEIAVSAPAATATTVEQHQVIVSSKDKKSVLLRLLERENVKNAFIFCNRKRDVATLAKFLADKGLNAGGLHGDMVQVKRNETLASFKSGELQYLVCSDVAARGLDVQAVSHVFNFDVPLNPDDYVHRIGRTGRAGKTGAAWMLVTSDDDKLIAAIEKRIQKPVPTVDLGGGKPVRSAEKPAKRSSEKSAEKPAEKSTEKTEKSTVTKFEDRPRRDTPPKERERDRDQDRNHRPRRHRDDDDSDVVGFGDDVPAFLR